MCLAFFVRRLGGSLEVRMALYQLDQYTQLTLDGFCKTSPKKVIADVSDIDGTVYKWQLLFDLVFGIARSFPEKAPLVEDLSYAVAQYRRRQGDFYVALHELLDILPQVFAGVPQDRIRRKAALIVDRQKSQVYTFPVALLRALRRLSSQYRGILIAITGAPQDIAELFCAEMGFDIVIGSRYEVDAQGRYTGVRDESSAIDKQVVMDAIERHCPVRWRIALGDSASDLPLLIRAQYRFAINPARDLQVKMVTRPELQIVRVMDHAKTGVHFALPDHQGSYRDVSLKDVLPRYLSHSGLFPTFPFLDPEIR